MRQALADTSPKVGANSRQLANHEGRIQSLESTSSSKFADLNKQVDDNRKRAGAGIAGVAAIANIPQVIQGQTFAVGAGVGNTDGESALAVGFSARATENVVVNAFVSNDT
ncbi:YadA C-terminal domain-containing protein [Enterobacter hormaechei]|uniref:YadA C-terminal domain-containing protein n=1 Tax=Enterobacter hormaechei TaxID=158836 RepID=UPI0009B585AE